MNKKLILSLMVTILILTAIIAVLLNRKDHSKNVTSQTAKTLKLDTSAPKFPE